MGGQELELVVKSGLEESCHTHLEFEKLPGGLELPLLSPFKCLSSHYHQQPWNAFSRCCFKGAECGARSWDLESDWV